MEPVSISAEIRSRAVSLPSLCCFSIFFWPPPSRSFSSSAWRSSTSWRMRLGEDAVLTVSRIACARQSVGFEKLAQPSREHLRIPRLAFPDHQRAPARLDEIRRVPPVPFHVAASLLAPELRARGRPHPPVRAIVHVPEATMHENHAAQSRKNQVGFPRQILTVEPVPKAHPVYQRTHHQLGLCVAPADRGHVPAA